jgi:quercetin dioxygenase-like cupin family protein
VQITRAGATPSARGPADYFIGAVRLDAPFKAEAPARVGGATVNFEPGARTAWHTHPLGQTLIVISGLGRCQREGGLVEEIRPGDIVWFPPGEKHWHGNGDEPHRHRRSPRRRHRHLARESSRPGLIRAQEEISP